MAKGYMPHWIGVMIIIWTRQVPKALYKDVLTRKSVKLCMFDTRSVQTPTK
jgi:hypothetical protein